MALARRVANGCTGVPRRTCTRRRSTRMPATRCSSAGSAGTLRHAWSAAAVDRNPPAPPPRRCGELSRGGAQARPARRVDYERTSERRSAAGCWDRPGTFRAPPTSLDVLAASRTTASRRLHLGRRCVPGLPMGWSSTAPRVTVARRLGRTRIAYPTNSRTAHQDQPVRIDAGSISIRSHRRRSAFDAS